MKRRKSRTISETTTSPQEKKMTKSQAGSTVNIDETEAEFSDAGSDVKSYRKACEEIKKLIEEIKDLKKEGKKIESPEINDRRIRCTLLFIILKKLNRLAHHRCKRSRDVTQGAKYKVDGLHLQLQNLLYEVMHLKKEITKCLEFKSKDEEIDLVSEEEFYNEAPEEFCKPKITKNDPHQRMLARLDWELEQRKRYASQKEEFTKHKDLLAKEIKTKKEFLDSLQPRLENILKSTLPVQEYLNLPLDAQRTQYETAKYLPLSLYVLYVQSSAYHEACDRHLDIQIHGDVDAAKAVLEEKPLMRTNEESDSDQEGTEEGTEKPRRSKRRRMKEQSRLLEEKKTLLKKHPLQVTIQFNFECKNSLTLIFSYLPNLNIVTATPSLSLVKSGDRPVLASRSLLSPESILDCLFPGDHGNSLPNPTNQFQLAKVGISDFSSIKDIGKPFLWAQKICGLEFLPDVSPVTAKSQLSSSHMEETIQAIKARILARLALQKQLAALEECRIPVIGSETSLFPHKVQSVLKFWRPLTYMDVVEVPFARTLITEDLISESDMFFIAQFERNFGETLDVVVVIYQDYPVKPPLFNLCVKINGTEIRDEMTRLVEAEVNVYYEELMSLDSHVNVLSNQLKRLQMCFDILIDSGYPRNIKNTEKLKNEKILLRGLKGRGRSLPFKYDSSVRIFTHR